MEVKSYGKLGFGIVLIVFGLAWVFDLWGNLVFDVPWQVWPVGLIIVGILFIVNQRGWAWMMIGLLLFFGVFNGVFYAADNYVEPQDFVYEFDLNGYDRVYLDVNYGAGDLILGRSDYADKIYFQGTTSDFEMPRIREPDDERRKIFLYRDSGVGFGDDEVWRIFLANDAIYDLDFEYGVSDVSLDLRGLDVERLDISEGVSDTEIWFGDYPTKVSIEGGVSDVDMKFSGDVGVVIRVDGGFIDKDFDGFVKRDGKWYNSFYDEDGENIIIEFSGGVGDLSAEFVEA